MAWLIENGYFANPPQTQTSNTLVYYLTLAYLNLPYLCLAII
jgi:hypothetical protein